MDDQVAVQRSAQMRRIRSKDTKPERLVRRLVHGMSYRYRLHRRDLPGSPDLVFPSRRKVIFVHGCFWHRHSEPSCCLTRTPKSRLGFWLPKFEANR
jgi:DNA mismatch endonuclease (patch repair protein)